MEKVSLVKCSSYDDKEVYNAVKKSVELIDGLKIKDNSKVLIKPNLLRPSHPNTNTTTHPSIVKAVIKLLKEKKCNVFVGDGPGFHDPKTTAKVCGILDVCKEENVPFVDFTDKKSYLIEDAMLIKRHDFAKIIDEVDYIINLPKLKTHVQMGITFAVKNTFGFIPGLNKSKLHLKLADKEKFAMMLLDVHNFIKPNINIIDAVFGMEGNGPTNGTSKKVGLIASSHDALALDIVMCKVVSFNPLDFWTNRVGLRLKEKDFIENIKITGEKLDEVKINFKHPEVNSIQFGLPKFVHEIIHNLIVSKPKVNSKKCVACQECIRICPAKTIHLKKYGKKQVAWINKKDCIRCFCCHEICNYDAIDIKKSILGEPLERLGKLLSKRQ
ncbi:MAG: DUF362 domain-containing protein [Nanoarchaeota archaeon]|nr:DUF362 domain-containing protein [Nanoarchaeota archaeon]